MEAYYAFIEKFPFQTVYFQNTFEQALIKSQPGAGYFVKFEGLQEISVHHSCRVVVEGILEYREISKEDYEKGQLTPVRSSKFPTTSAQ